MTTTRYWLKKNTNEGWGCRVHSTKERLLWDIVPQFNTIAISTYPINEELKGGLGTLYVMLDELTNSNLITKNDVKSFRDEVLFFGNLCKNYGRVDAARESWKLVTLLIPVILHTNETQIELELV